MRPDFNLLDFFRTFDTLGVGAVSTIELEEGMRKYGVYANREELYLFIRKYDSDKDGKLRFSDFSEAFTPKQSEYSSLLNGREPVNQNGNLDIVQVSILNFFV